MTAQAYPVTLPISFVTDLIWGLRSQPEAVATCIEKSGISMELIEADEGRVTVEQYQLLYQSMVSTFNDELPGLFSRRVPRGNLKFLCLALLSSRNLLVAMRRYAQYLPMTQDDLVFEVTLEDFAIKLALTERRAVRGVARLAHELLVKLAHGTFSWLIGKNLQVEKVCFAFAPPAHVSEYVYLFPGPVHFDQNETALYFNLSLTREPVRRDIDSLRTFLYGSPGQWLHVLDSALFLSHKVRDHLKSNLDRDVQVAEAARVLHMSTRSLVRHLAKEGTTFKSLKNDLRRDTAIYHLVRGHLPISRIADDLGFEDQSAFSRAFKRWTGVTPFHYKTKLQARDMT